MKHRIKIWSISTPQKTLNCIQKRGYWCAKLLGADQSA